MDHSLSLSTPIKIKSRLMRRERILVQAFDRVLSPRLNVLQFLFLGISETLMSRFRTPPLGWLLLLDIAITQRLCSVFYTGYQYASVSISRLPRSSIGRCLAVCRRTSLADDCCLTADARERLLRSIEHAIPWRKRWTINHAHVGVDTLLNGQLLLVGQLVAVKSHCSPATNRTAE